MNLKSFSLIPVPGDPRLPGLQINGSTGRDAAGLAIRYELRGPLAQVALPGVARFPARRHGLWEETCFEFFLGVKDDPGYWEFNLSPAGDWNVYHFAAYRQGMEEEMAFAVLPFQVRRRGDSLKLALEVEVGRIVPAARSLEVGVSAVLQREDGRLSYWALSHPGPEADFHRREGFLIPLEGVAMARPEP